MFITLYTSRVILDALGIIDYGIHSMVAGFVSMFWMISAPLSLSISRFITFELGKGNFEKLKLVFSTSINIQIALTLLLIVLGETFGLWFLNTQINIPEERIHASFWVFQCAILELSLYLLNIPYNAVIISHEKMSVFAYISIVEGILKLLISYLIYISLWDKLVFYAILLVFVSLVLRFVYIIYCNNNFHETHYIFIYDKSLLKEMSSYAGWDFISNFAGIMNTHGLNILINIFFGVTANAARGIATRVESAVNKFAVDFTTAINPQIIKQYASGNIELMIQYVCQGAKFSYFLILLISFPLIFETETILNIWLVEVPEYTIIFTRLTVISTCVTIIGRTCSMACHATGRIKEYSLIETFIVIFVFPVTWFAYKLNAPIEFSYYIFILFYGISIIGRLFILKWLINFSVLYFIKKVILRIFIVTIIALIFPLTIVNCFNPGLFRLFLFVVFTTLTTSFTVLLFGMTAKERTSLLYAIKSKVFSHKI